MPGNYKNILGRRRSFKDKCLREYKITSLHTYTQRWQKYMNQNVRINIYIYSKNETNIQLGPIEFLFYLKRGRSLACLLVLNIFCKYDYVSLQ